MKWIKIEQKKILKNNCFNRTLNFFNIEGLEGTKKINDLERVLKDNKINYVVKDYEEKLTKNKIGILLYDFKTVLHIQPFIDNNYYDVYPTQLKGKPCKIIIFKGYKRESR